jgi:hypothetical protein
MTGQQVATAPGWYAQPDGEQKYWDGHKYTAAWNGTSPVLDAPSTTGVVTVTPAIPSSVGFFDGLFDFSFTTFITLKIVRAIFIVGTVSVLLAAAGAFIMIFSRGGWYTLMAIVGVPLVTLIYLVLLRVSLEMIALFFRIGENTSLMLAKL